MATLGAACRFVFLFVTVLITVSTACPTCSTRWIKVYETDSEGVVLAGDPADLVTAHSQGSRIRYMVKEWGEAGIVEELDFSLLTFSLTDICGESVMHSKKDRWDHFDDEGYWRFSVVCSNGIIETYTYTLGETIEVDESIVTIGIAWYILDVSCPDPVYAHDDGGTSMSGDKNELIEGVLAGYDVKYLVEDYLYPAHNLDVAGGEVVSQTIWNINTPEQSAAQWWFVMTSTTSLSDSIVWNLGEHVTQDHSANNEQLEWRIDPCWRHVYTNDAHGNQESGSLADLIAAVERGNRVKIMIGTYSVETDNVRTTNGQVSAQILAQVSKADSEHFLDDTYWVWQMVHTTGTVRTRRYSIGITENRGDSAVRKTISWYVDTRRWKKVYSSSEYGCVSGSKADLKMAIESGAPVRIGLQFDIEGKPSHDGKPWGWFVMKAEGLEFSSTGEVAAELIKSVSTEEFCHLEYRIQDAPFWHFMVVTTESNVDIAQWRVGAHISDGHYTKKANVNWFVSY